MKKLEYRISFYGNLILAAICIEVVPVAIIFALMAIVYLYWLINTKD